MARYEIRRATDGEPPLDSYWVAADRETLQARVQARKHVQALPSEKHLKFDPLPHATIAWQLRRLAYRMAKRRQHVRGR